jgi:hypothetical protein
MAAGGRDVDVSRIGEGRGGQERAHPAVARVVSDIATNDGQADIWAAADALAAWLEA